jgi:hypothetical protein
MAKAENEIVRDDYFDNPLQEGRKLEHRVKELCKYLGGISGCRLSKTGSAADCILKVDLILYPVEEPSLCYGIQIKSAQWQADEHAARGAVVYRGESFNMPPVIVEGSNWYMLQQLSTVTLLPYSPIVIETLEVIQVYKEAGRTSIPYGAIPRTVKTCIAELGLLTPTQHEFIVN